MTTSHFASFPVPKAMWTEVVNEVAVVWEHPEALVNQEAKFIHCFDVCICSTAMRSQANI